MCGGRRLDIRSELIPLSPLAGLNQMTVVQGSTTRFNRSYGYDDVGNVTAITNNSGTGNDQTFGYDHRDRLTSWGLDGVSNTYQYNAIGNLINHDGTAYTYPASGVTSTRPHAVSSIGGSYSYDNNGNLTSGGGRSYSWNVANQPTSITSGGVTETYTYNGDGARTTKTRNGTTTVYLEGLWEQTGGVIKSYYTLGGKVVAVRDSSDTTNYPAYLHGDHLGSVSVVTNSVGGAVTQEFDPWGKLRSGGTSTTKRNYTGQYLDDTGLLFYNARYYDPTIGRFVSADTIVPGNASGGMDGVAIKGLTVAFHETGLASQLGQENQQPFWFQMSDQQRQQVGSPWGPVNPQALNRYAYVQNNPLKYTDPSGHEAICMQDFSACSGARVVNQSSKSILVKGDILLPDGTVQHDVVFRLGPGQSSISVGIFDVDEIYVDSTSIDGYGPGYGTKLNDGETVTVTDDTNGQLTVGRKDWLPFGWGSAWYPEPYGNAATIANIASTPQGVDLSNSRQITGAETFWARAGAYSGVGDYRDCTAAGACALP